MYKFILGLSGALLFIVPGCSTGSGHPSHADGGVGGTDAGIKPVSDAGLDAANVGSPPACGSFELDSGGFFKSGLLHGLAWTTANKESTISPANFDTLPEGGPLCAQGLLARPSNGGYAYAILGIDIGGVMRTASSQDAGADAAAASTSEEVNAVIPISDGLIVNVSNKGNSALWLCLQGVFGQQWCVKQLGETTFFPWNSFVDVFGSGISYANEPLMAIGLTVPDPGSATSTFDICLNSIVEAASFCQCPGGVCACPSGTTLCAAACVADKSINPNNCGACGKACSSTSACSSGQCRDTIVPDPSHPYVIAIDGTHLYFTDLVAGTVMRSALTGGAPEMLASGQVTPAYIAVDSQNVYWVNAGTSANKYADGAIMKVALAGGTPITVASGQTQVDAIAAYGNSVYWVSAGTAANNHADGAIMKVASDGGAPVTIVSGQSYPAALAFDSLNVYWTNQGTSSFAGLVADGSVMQMPLNGGTPTVLASGQSAPGALAVDSTKVYWATSDTVFSVPLSGGVPVVLADKQSIPWYIVLDGTNAYWTNYFGGSVVKVPLGGGTPVTLAVGQNQALGIAMDATHLYFTTDDGAGSGALLSLLK